MSQLTVADPRLALRLLYEALAVTLGRDGKTVPAGGSVPLPRMAPRPLLPAETLPGSSEFTITALPATSQNVQRAGTLTRKAYAGYVALHFPLDMRPGDGTDEGTLIMVVLERYGGLLRGLAPPGVQYAGMSDPAGDLFLNTLPSEQNVPSGNVLTLSVDFQLTLDLHVQFQ